MYKHLHAVIRKLRSLVLTAPPQPWRLVNVLAVGGLRSVGYDRYSDNLLIVSIQGRGVVDCLSGEKITRDYSEDYPENEVCLECEGIGPLGDSTIQMMGLFGGGLPVSTEDDWSIESVTLDWPQQMLILLPPGSTLHGSVTDYSEEMHKIFEDSTIRAYGFSYTGRSFVIATTSDVTVYSRQ